MSGASRICLPKEGADRCESASGHTEQCSTVWSATYSGNDFQFSGLICNEQGFGEVGLNMQPLPAEVSMLYWTLMFLVIAIVAAFLGFGGVAIAAAGIAKILFFVFLVLFVVSLLMNVTRRA